MPGRKMKWRERRRRRRRRTEEGWAHGEGVKEKRNERRKTEEYGIGSEEVVISQ